VEGSEPILQKPVVAVVGRPNTGKSAFFNYVSGKRISIVDDTPGVTRDRIYTTAEWRSRSFILIDTGGIEPYSNDSLMQQMREQAQIAIETADVIILMVDGKSGVAALDSEVAVVLRKAGKNAVLAVNKIDNIGEPPPNVYEFYKLGFKDLHCISSIHGLGVGDLLDCVFEYFPGDIEKGCEEKDVIKVAIIGKPNTGKSSLVNKLLGEERVIVSEVPGTTRDAIDSYINKNGINYVIIDTAGIRKKSRINKNIEKYSIIRALTAVERADVCLIMIDACDGITEQDKKIAGYANEQGKGSIIVINKWDLIEKKTGSLETYRNNVYEQLKFLSYAPVIFISVKTGQRVERLYELIDHVNEQAALRISTGMLNDVINEATAMVQPPSDKGKRLRIFYTTQVSIRPPKLVIFVNNIKLMHFSYERYLENQLRKSFGFEGTPIRFIIKERVKKE